MTTVVITGVTTENCCHATARDAFFRDFQVVFLADATANNDYPDLGYGSMSAEEVHRATLDHSGEGHGDIISTETFVTRVATARDSEQFRAPNPAEAPPTQRAKWRGVA